VGTPLIFLLLFVYVFGRTLGAGIGGSAGGGRYVDYVAPGVFVMTVASALVTTAVSSART
jgi:ABC-2 type transport system permease protein